MYIVHSIDDVCCSEGMYALQYDPEFIVSFDCFADTGQSLDDDKNYILLGGVAVPGVRWSLV